VPVATLPDIEKILAETRVDLAMNVHSFSECSSRAIAWWLDLLSRAEDPYIIFVPNATTENRRSVETSARLWNNEATACWPGSRNPPACSSGVLRLCHGPPL
jgi:hypothetical protein